MTNFPTHHYLLQPKKKNLDVGFSWVARNTDKLPKSSSSFSFSYSLVEMITSREACCCFLLFFLTCRRCWWIGIPTCRHPWLFVFSRRRWWWASWLIIAF
jgi:hypothetical protein